jgi:DNA processing protein
MDSAFWQRLLSAELPPERCRAIIRALGSSRYTESDLLVHAEKLFANERDNIRNADMDALQKALSNGANVLPFFNYPEVLTTVPSAPSALFLWGNRECLDQPTVGIVGTRGASAYGKAAANKFAESLALAGVTVVSGGAAGIDAAAHIGAIEAGGQTVAVLGTGIEQAYPAMNRDLFRRIREHGCLISQFAAGAKPRTYRFPVRNHMIAALSHAVIVVEAPSKSGALITASAAAEMGRQVFVVPANITNISFQGSHALIRDGAALVDHPDQVLEALSLAPGSQRSLIFESNEAQNKIIKALSTSPMTSERIATETGIDTNELLSELTLLEIDGRIGRESGLFVLKG